MKKKKLCKRGSALLLVAAMIVSTLAGIAIKPMEVKATPATIGSGYFQANKRDGSFLSAYSLSSATSTPGKIRFAKGEWYITGYENGALVLLSSDGSKTVTFNADGTSKYSSSDLTPEKLLTMFDSNFTDAEKEVLSDVTVKTDENDDSGSKVSATGKLYLPNAQSPSSYGPSYTTIYLGAEDTISVFIGSGTNLSISDGYGFFWLRSPYDLDSYIVLVAYLGYYVGSCSADREDASAVPACHLNLSSVLFASAAEAATSSNVSAMNGATLTADTFTLRYEDTASNATVTYSADGVQTTSANGKYLMVQTKDNQIYAKEITTDNQTFTLSDIGVPSLTENDRVWVESTTENVTYAKLGTWTVKKAVTVNNGTGDGNYTEGATVTITADAAPSGKQFKEWKVVSGGVTLASSTSASTTFTMPASAVEVTAVYEDVTPPAPTEYAVTVNNGTGGGNYTEGATVTITADAAPSGKRFKEWKVVSGGVTLASSTSASTTFTMPAGAVEVTAVYEAAERFRFIDVSESDWFYNPVYYAYDNGIMSGTGNSKFSPLMSTDRSMVVQILYNVSGKPAMTGITPFDDVPSNQWYAKAVQWAAETGVTAGVSKNSFAPEREVTRQEVAALLFRYAKLQGYDVSGRNDLSSFVDGNQVDGWALESMQWANNAGIINGKGNSRLDPRGTATRAEIATMMKGFMTKYQ